MTWRRVPPVSSPIAPLSLVGASAAAMGVTHAPTDGITRDLTATFAATDAVLTGSGTEALTLALRAVASPGSTVAMPGYVCIDLISAAIGANVRVSLYDVDPATMAPDLASLTDTLRRGARALVVAPLYGYPVAMQPIVALAREHGVPLIEDAAQAAGATLDGRRVGSFGDLTVLSFGRGKGMTGGSGGALLARDARYAERVREMRDTLAPPSRGVRDIVALSAQWVLGRPMLYTLPASIPALGLGEMIYKPPREPSALSASAASILPTALRLNDGEVAARRRVAAELQAACAGSQRFAAIQAVAGALPGFLRFAVRDTTGTVAPRPEIGALRGYPITLDEHVETKRVLLAGQPDLPGARTLRDRLFTLPTHSMVTRADLERMIRWLT